MTAACEWRSATNGTGLTATLLDDPATLCLRGEADALSLGVLQAVITALPASVGEIHLELAGLSFIDVCSTRELIALARRPARPRLILHQPPYCLTRLIGLLGADCHQATAPPGNSAGNDATVGPRVTRAGRRFSAAAPLLRPGSPAIEVRQSR